MDPAETRKVQAEYVRGLPNFAEIKAAGAPSLHIEGEVLNRFTNEFIVLTPMNMDPSVSYMMLSRFDYVKEHAKLLSGGAAWDDTSSNRAQVGDLFAFVFYQPAKGVDKMEIFEIVDILGPEHRRSNWVIAGHSNRRVLLLSKYLGRVSYSAFAAAKGYKLISDERYSYVRGTVRTKWQRDLYVKIQGQAQQAEEEE